MSQNDGGEDYQEPPLNYSPLERKVIRPWRETQILHRPESSSRLCSGLKVDKSNAHNQIKPRLIIGNQHTASYTSTGFLS